MNDRTRLLLQFGKQNEKHVQVNQFLAEGYNLK